MRTSLTILGTRVQVTLSPETPAEKALLAFLDGQRLQLAGIKRAEVFGTQGGYIRHVEGAPGDLAFVFDVPEPSP